MKDSNLTKRYNNLSYLYSDFRREIEQLLLSIGQNQLPFVLYETYRTPQRQKALISKGYSTERYPFRNPHVNGLAIDLLLDRRAIVERTGDSLTLQSAVDKALGDKPSAGLVYDLGTNLIPTNNKAPRTIVENEAVLNYWRNLGTLIERQFPKLCWGGNKNVKTNQLIGEDPTHVEFRGSQNLIESGIALREIKQYGAPGIKL
jgi:hypothetical protein